MLFSFGGKSGIMVVKEGKDEVKYEDITHEFIEPKEYEIKEQQFFIDSKGIKYDVDGKHVIIKLTEREKEVANILGKLYGGQVNLVPVVLYPKETQTPDYIINNTKYDLKDIFGNGKNTLDTAINKKRKQSNNFIFDISKTEMSEEQALIQIEKIYNAKNRIWVDTIILIKNGQVLKIFKRK